ncbi:DUF72 domain-containing protein [Cytophaga hutchinsonii]|uniref:DUF72 domain-containing protein n=1 Tax=Cytophaga hutchinsonii (strain ATCC 33406 / DSM 1761 / CIP 103989 / NBRC 15051 / NCIMB 9469 / D465) TaxID=269798 RepID=A0A6N4SUT3_CYTH3|nr:DUF72 domain-containing protein [Cytophaga hutchinsonii]ABG60087.1 conserved hypothetical protein [Cytophaga hutchinsonii ATCC 33406]SFX24419.1 Uncharacterized conserved protein YecE, DUF72 family [Cytophaga hutchinsonii ATCC 33406]
MRTHIGCSGYNYREWKGMFYPEGLPQSKWLEYYCRHYNTVEINASFYRFPTGKSLKTWYDKTPADFRFSLKANNQITHYKKFNGTQSLISELYEVAAAGLKDKLECILFQLPPSVKYTPEILERIVSQLDPAFKNVLEFRDAGWWNNEVYKVLQSKNIVFCTSSYPGLPEDFITTADTAYIRMHGNTELYKSNYSDNQLQQLRNDLIDSDVKEAFVYFDNTWGGNAIANAKTMEKLMQLKHT